MLRLRLLGTVSIEHAAAQSARPTSSAATRTPATPLNGAAVQRRPLALLAFLATAREAGRSREEVLLHLWPDSTPARARNVLKQTLYTLRRDLHAPDVVLTDGDRYRLNAAVLTSDVAEFEAALERGETERALALYQGPFLRDFSLDVPEFERWMQEERERFAARAETARRAMDAGDPPPLIPAPSTYTPQPLRHGSARQFARAGLIALVALTSVVVLQAGRLGRRTALSRPTVNPTRIAVAPFDVTSADPALGFLGAGIVDLLSVRLTGDGHSDLRAERLGAGRIIHGKVVGTPSRLVLTAEMLAAPSEEPIARTSIVGTADSLSVLVDRLAAALLLGADPSDAAAEPAMRATLATTPLAAIRDYVEGQAAYRAGRYDDAVRRFDNALARDSTFALAALGLAQSAGWAGAPAPTIQRGARLAWKYEDRLTRRARLALAASVGSREALRTGYVSDTAVIGAAERAADANPDDPEQWYWLGDRLLHVGSAMGLTAALERATAALRRAVTLDPTFAPAYVHLVQLTARSGDTAAMTELGRQLLERDSTSESAQFVRWRIAVALGDSAALRALRSRFDEMPLGTLRLILATAESDAVGLGDADRALAAMLRRSATTDERANALVHAHAYALDRGRWAQALDATAAFGDDDPFPRWHLRIRVLDALYAGGDTAAARAAVDSLQPFADAPLAHDARARAAQYDDASVVMQWRLWHGDRRGLARAVQRLAGTPSLPDSLRRQVVNGIAVALLHAIATNTGGSHDVAAVETLDTLVAANVLAPFEWPGLYPSLVAARLFAQNGRTDRALAAVQRQLYYFPESTYLAASRTLEAQLAAQVGDVQGPTYESRPAR